MPDTMKTAATKLAKLGHVKRLEIYRFLIKCGAKGAPVGELQQALGIPGSTLSHHLNTLMSVGLVVQRREGRVLICTAQYEQLDQLIDFLMAECCAGKVPASPS